jgi:hypothetical protein
VRGTACQPTFQPLRAVLRPPRTVVVFDGGDNWISNAALAMHTCQGIWGGSGFLLIPHHDGQVRRSLRRLACSYDPDYVVPLPITTGQFEAINPGVLRMRGVDGTMLEGAERIAAFEYSQDIPVRDLTGYDARALLAGDCTPHRYWLSGGDSERDSHHEQTQHLDMRDHGPFTSIEQFGASQPSDAGIPSSLTGLWALAAAMRVGFAEAPPLPFPKSSPVDRTPMMQLMQEALRPPSYGRYRSQLEQRWNSAWQPSETRLATVWIGQVVQRPHLVVIGATAEDFALAQGWQLRFGSAHWIPEAHLPLEGPVQHVAWTLAQELITDPEYRNKGALLTSASVPLDQLQQLAQEWAGDARVAMTYGSGDEATQDGSVAEPDVHLKCTKPETLPWDHGTTLVIEEDYDLPLALPAQESDQGDVSLLVNLPPLTPSDSALRRTDGLTWQIDLLFQDSTTPHTRRLSPRVLQPDEDRSYESIVRRSRNGLTCYSANWGFVSGGATSVQRLAKPRLRQPGLYSWAQAHAEDHDMNVRFSAAGHRVEILRRMWGSRAALSQEWAGPLRPIFLDFQPKAKKSQDASPKRMV